MQAIILAGGKGTRLRPLTVYTPKPIVPFANRPFLLYQIDLLKRAGITDITLSLNYQPDKIEHQLGYGPEFGVELKYVTEPSPMGTGGAYKYASNAITDTTVVFNGDILTDLDLARAIEFHRAKKAEATIVLTPVENPSAYGLVDSDEEDRVLRFLEKPKGEELESLTTNNINAGIYILEPGILDLIPENENYSFEYDVFPSLLEKKKSFYAFVLENEYWRDIGNPVNYLSAHLDLLKGDITGFEIDRSGESDIATSTEIDRLSVIGENCTIKPGVSIRNSVIGEGVHIEEKAQIEDSVIWAHTRINSSAEIHGSIIGRGCYIGRNAVVSTGCVLGDKTSLTDYTKV
ncbi:MAG: NDP-sugar synthase [Pyrinomonadaceae bacterium]|nr:NDP-sugar synthase [Pyrinomonadaceae bacterium]